MIEQRIEALRRVYAEWARGNWRAGAELLAPNVHCVWQAAPGEVVSDDPHELHHNLAELLAQWAGFRVFAEEYIPLGHDAVLVTARQSARGRRSGARVEMPINTVWVFGGQHVTELYWYFDREQAIAAAGLATKG